MSMTMLKAVRTAEKRSRRFMKKEEFNKQREVLYRELLTSLRAISSHPVVQCQIGLRDACVDIAKNYRQLNQIIDEVVR
jgi:hypothetical protein